MIIDSHTHIGCISYPVGKNRVSNLLGQDLLKAMRKYSIDFALVSSIGGAEFDSEMQLAPVENQIPQMESFRSLVQFVQTHGGISLKHTTSPPSTRGYSSSEEEEKVIGLITNNSPSFLKEGCPDRKVKDGVVKGLLSRMLMALLWIKPYTEMVTEALEQFITENRDHIAGLKMHPSLSNIKYTDDRFMPYIELAVKYNLPVQVHTENDGLSDPAFVAEMAALYPDIRFVMVHMGLGTDNSEAIGIIRNNSNVYGDTCEVKINNVIKAIDECGSEKILFGTDAVVHGIDTYQRYLPLIKSIRANFTGEEADNVLFRNSVRLYRISL